VVGSPNDNTEAAVTVRRTDGVRRSNVVRSGQQALSQRERWAAHIQVGDAVLVHGQPRIVLGIRRLGPLAPYFRFERGGIFMSYTRTELAEASQLPA
jgi:hypothetical protein